MPLLVFSGMKFYKSKRRSILLGALIISLFLGGNYACQRGLSGSQKQGEKLNVVLVLVDDLGWKDLACYGSAFYDTPQLDAFAE